LNLISVKFIIRTTQRKIGDCKIRTNANRRNSNKSVCTIKSTPNSTDTTNRTSLWIRSSPFKTKVQCFNITSGGLVETEGPAAALQSADQHHRAPGPRVLLDAVAGED
jgi:hypothetical protein